MHFFDLAVSGQGCITSEGLSECSRAGKEYDVDSKRLHTLPDGVWEESLVPRSVRGGHVGQHGTPRLSHHGRGSE